MSAIMENATKTQKGKALLYDSIVEHCRWQAEFYRERQANALAKMNAAPISDPVHMAAHQLVLDYSGLLHEFNQILRKFAGLEAACDCYLCVTCPKQGGQS